MRDHTLYPPPVNSKRLVTALPAVVVRAVMHAAAVELFDPWYSWQGINHARRQEKFSTRVVSSIM
jgi:hypothetical protein